MRWKPRGSLPSRNGDGEIVDHGDGDEIDVFSIPVLPMCATLATIYLLSPIQNAVVESIFSHQNLILTNRRFRMVIDKVGIKVSIKVSYQILDKATKLVACERKETGS